MLRVGGIACRCPHLPQSRLARKKKEKTMKTPMRFILALTAGLAIDAGQITGAIFGGGAAG